MRDLSWIRINDLVIAQVDYDLLDYERSDNDQIMGRLTGLVLMARSAVAEGKYGLSVIADEGDD